MLRRALLVVERVPLDERGTVIRHLGATPPRWHQTRSPVRCRADGAQESIVEDQTTPAASVQELPPDGAVRIPIRVRSGDVVAYTLVDAADADWVNQWTWRLEPYGYAFRGTRANGRYYPIKLHRALMGLGHGDPRQVDHINHDGFDNRRANLRVVTRSENLENRRGAVRSSKTGVRGVSLASDCIAPRYIARVRMRGVDVFRGRFKTLSEAEAAVKSARRRLMTHAPECSEAM